MINFTEKADGFVIELAVLLHDVGDRKVIKQEEDDYTIAENFLKKEDMTLVPFIVKELYELYLFYFERYNFEYAHK